MKRFLTALMAIIMVFACCSVAMAEEKPATWIADRTIVIQCYVDDIGYSLPEDINETLVGKKVTELTGIKLDLRYTPGESDAVVMAAQMAAGNIPDAIISYLNNSTRPEFPILLKGAKEGLFADMSEFLPEMEIYSRYLEEDYLPADARDNITFRDDLDGAYIFQLQVGAEDESTIYKPDSAYIGGLYIRADIAEAIGFEAFSLETQEQLYDICVQIQNGNFTDDNGNPIYAIGPKYWGGSYDSLINIVKSYGFSPFGSEYGLTTDGQIVHEAQTNYVYDKINFARKLLAEGLMHPEFFTMDTTRADELYNTKGVAIASDIHNYVDVIYQSEDWIPMGSLQDVTGSTVSYTSGKGGYGAFAISSEAENPEEILKYFDFLASYEGQLLTNYGIEGVTYNMVDGYPVMTDEAKAAIQNGDKEFMVETVGACYSGGVYFWSMASTNMLPSEAWGGNTNAEMFPRAVALGEQNPRTEIVKVPGLDVSAYLSVAELADVKASMDLLNYKEMVMQAIHAPSDEDATAIVESFRGQLKAAGIEKLYDYVEALYAANPETIQLMAVEATVAE